MINVRVIFGDISQVTKGALTAAFLLCLVSGLVWTGKIENPRERERERGSEGGRERERERGREREGGWEGERERERE